jgi:hypothetical protein
VSSQPKDEVGGFPDAETLLEEITDLSNRVAREPNRRLAIQVEWHDEMKAKYGRQGAEAGWVMRSLNMGDGTNININAQTSNIGNLNTGTQTGNVANAIKSLSMSADADSKKLAELLQRLDDAIAGSSEIEEKPRHEALQLVETVAIEAAKPAGERRLDGIKRALELLPPLVAVGQAAHQAWDAAEPVIRSLFGF